MQSTTLSRLKASDLESLEVAYVTQCEARYADPEASECVQVTHKGQTYSFGRFDCWRGPYWMHDTVSGSVFTGSLGACKEFAQLCTQCAQEEQAAA